MNRNYYHIIANIVCSGWITVTTIIRARTKNFIPGFLRNNCGLHNMRRFASTMTMVLGSASMVIVPQIRADVVPDASAPGALQPQVGTTASGVTQVNIQTPSAAGVSRNVYTQFDVDRNGVILNNSSIPVSTQLGGWINGNPNLAGGTAQIILNEVNSANPSSLLGYVEIGGARAQVVIANPSGITCNGCGFINASRATLTTGTPLMEDGALNGFQVDGGTISITGDGMDTSGVNYTDLISRAVEINAGIWANDLKITTGINRVSADNSQIIKGASPGGKPEFAIDVASLGGMYAGKIKLVGTEEGVGVRNAGVIGSTAGAITISADGKLVNSNEIRSSQAITVNTTDNIENSGVIYGQGDIHITTTGELTNRGALDGQETVIEVATLNNLSTGQIYGDHIAIDADTVNNLGDGSDAPVIAARTRLDIGATTINNQEGALLFSLDSINIGGELDVEHHASGSATTINNISASIEALGDLNIVSDTLINKKRIFSTAQVAGELPSGLELLMYDPDLYAFWPYEDAPYSLWRDYYLNLYLNHIASISGINMDTAYRNALVSAVNAMSTESIKNTSNIWSTLITKISEDHSEWIDVMAQRLSGLDFPLVAYDQKCLDPGCDYVHYIEHHRTDTKEIITSDSPSATILAGGDANLTIGDLQNYYSSIESGGDMVITGSTLHNEGAELYYDSHTLSTYHQIHWGENDHGTTSTSSTDSTLLEAVPAIISAGGTLMGSHTASIDNVSIRENSTPTTNSVGGGLLDSADVPSNSLYHINPDATSNYLVETDPRFASYGNWLSSDYMLEALSLDPTLSQKRMGDGFYEQRLIQKQINELTGHRYLAGYTNDEDQYKALMNAGVTFAQEYELTPGVALSAEQIAQLTSDMIWLVEQEVTLADGSSQKVLVPQVYVSAQTQKVNSSGAMITANKVLLDVGGDLGNSGDISGREIVIVQADNLNNVGGRISAGDALGVYTEHDLNVVSSTNTTNLEHKGIKTDGSARATAEINQINRVAGLYVENAGGILVASAGDDINLLGAKIGNQGADGQTYLEAGQDINLGTVAESNNNYVKGKNSWARDNSKSEAGSSISTSGDLTMSAGRDLNARAASVSSELGAIDAVAERDINIEAGEAERSKQSYRKNKKKGTFSSKSTTVYKTSDDTGAIASTFSGEEINLDAGNDLKIEGSNVVATNDVNIRAEGDINIEAATETHNQTYYKKTKKSGVFSTGSGVTIGKQKMSTDTKGQTTTAAASTVGSIKGDVNIQADQTYNQTGSDLIALEGDVNITADEVNIKEARETSNYTTKTKFKQSGLSINFSNPVIEMAQTAQNMSENMGKTDKTDARMQALAAGASSAYGAYNAVDQGMAKKDGNLADQAGGVKLSVSFGASKSKSTSTSASDTARGSTLVAGGDININALEATGAGESEDSSTTPTTTGSGNVNIQGSDLTAGNNINLYADNDITMQSAENRYSSSSKSKSSSASVGVSFNLGANAGVGLDVAASKGKGKSTGNAVTYDNSHVTAGNKLTIESGNDTTMKGAVAKGEQVEANIGGNLTIESQQDIDDYSSESKNSGFSVSIPIYGNATFGANVNGEKKNIDSEYASVTEQSGIKAGDEGFQIDVNGHTQLTGAVIASNDVAVDNNKNGFSTGTISTSDIKNRAKVDASSDGYGLDTDMFTQGKYGIAKGIIENTMLDSEKSSSSSGQTRSAISEGTVVITDEAGQFSKTGQTAESTIASLNRDTANSHVAAEKQDVEAIMDAVEAERKIKQAIYAEGIKFTDEAYRVSFLVKAKIYKVDRDEDGNIALDGNGNPVMHELTDEEKNALEPGSDNKVHFFTNGIYNDEYAAAGYTSQMSEEGEDNIYLVYFQEANNALSELIVAGYQKYMEGGVFDLTNPTQLTLSLMQQYGVSGLDLVGHSRGAMTIGNAMEAFYEQGGSAGALSNTDVSFYGGAYNAQEAANLLYYLSGGANSTVQLQNHADDFVGVLIGGNPATFDQRPVDSSKLEEWINMFGDSPTVHSCYGSASKACKDTYGIPSTIEINKD